MSFAVAGGDFRGRGIPGEGAVMNPLVAKEIRLLMPAFGLALMLAIVPVWLFPNPDHKAVYIAVYPFCFGTVMLALSSFGREFGLRTFPLLLWRLLCRPGVWWPMG